MKSLQLVISIIQELANGKRIKVGDDTIAMSEEGHIGYVLQKDGEETIAGDISIRNFAKMVEEHEIIPIFDVKK